jgi:hypothetical protein
MSFPLEPRGVIAEGHNTERGPWQTATASNTGLPGTHPGIIPAMILPLFRVGSLVMNVVVVVMMCLGLSLSLALSASMILAVVTLVMIAVVLAVTVVAVITPVTTVVAMEPSTARHFL